MKILSKYKSIDGNKKKIFNNVLLVCERVWGACGLQFEFADALIQSEYFGKSR